MDKNEYMRNYNKKHKDDKYYCKICEKWLKKFSKYVHIRSQHHKLKYFEKELNKLMNTE